MRAEKRRHITKRCLIIQLLDRAQNLQLVFQRQAVSGFRFDRCRACSQKPIRVTFPDLHQIVLRRVARSSNCSSDAAAARSDLAIGRTAYSLLEFVCANAGKYRMRVRVHKPRHRDAFSGVNYFTVICDQGFDFAPPAHGFDVLTTN